MVSGMIAEEANVKTGAPPGRDWTVVLRRQATRIVEGQPEGGYTDAFELICCDCGDDPDLDYPEVAPEIQRIRGPYSIAAGVAAYGQHVSLHELRQASQGGRQRPMAKPARQNDETGAARERGRRGQAEPTRRPVHRC
jgi:hypothetical protein